MFSSFVFVGNTIGGCGTKFVTEGEGLLYTIIKGSSLGSSIFGFLASSGIILWLK